MPPCRPGGSTRTSGAGTPPSSPSGCGTGRRERAATELLSLFGAQWRDGRVPHIVFNPAVPDDAYFPGPAFWRSETSRDIRRWKPRDHPAARARDRRGGSDERLGAAAWPSRAGSMPTGRPERLSAERAHGWPDGLAAVVHPWEAGMDNSPAWDAPLHAVPADLSLFDTYTRRTSATPEPVNGRRMRTTPATSGWRWRIEITATTMTGSAPRPSSGRRPWIQRAVGLVGAGAGRAGRADRRRSGTASGRG